MRYLGKIVTVLGVSALPLIGCSSSKEVKYETYRKADVSRKANVTCAVSSEMLNVATNDPNDPNVYRREPGDTDLVYCHTDGLLRLELDSFPRCIALNGCYEALGRIGRTGEIKLLSVGFYPKGRLNGFDVERERFMDLVSETVRKENRIKNDPNENDFKLMDRATLLFKVK